MKHEQIKKDFERLNSALDSYDLPTEAGHTRRGVSADEFMLMSADPIGNVKFKHCITRNYLVLREDDTIYIPKGGAFFLGFFDADLEAVYK